MSTQVSVSVATTIANAVKAQVRTYGQTVAMIKAAYAAEGMSVGPTLSEVVGILLNPAKTKGGESERVTFYETFRKTAQRAIGDDCLLPPVFLLDKATSQCRVVLLAKDVTIEQVKAAGLPTREENKALMAIMVRDKVAAPKATPEEPDAPDAEGQEESSNESPAPAPAATDFDQLVTLLSGMDAEQVRLLVGAIAVANPAQLVTLGDAVNTALIGANKQAQAAAQVNAYKSAGAAPSTMAAVATDMSADAATSVPAGDVIAAAVANTKPARQGHKRAAKRAA